MEPFPYWSQNKSQVQHKTRNKRPNILNLPPAFEIEGWDSAQIFDYRSRKHLHIHIKMIKNYKSPTHDNSSKSVNQNGRLFLRGDYVTKCYHVQTEQRKWRTEGRTTCLFHLTHLCTGTRKLPGYSYPLFVQIPHPRKTALGGKLPTNPELIQAFSLIQ